MTDHSASASPPKLQWLDPLPSEYAEEIHDSAGIVAVFRVQKLTRLELLQLVKGTS